MEMLLVISLNTVLICRIIGSVLSRKRLLLASNVSQRSIYENFVLILFDLGLIKGYLYIF